MEFRIWGLGFLGLDWIQKAKQSSMRVLVLDDPYR